jgi:hypothetical protein
MFKNKKLVNGLVAKIGRAERYALQSLRSGRVEHEPALTDRLIASIESTIDGTEIGGVTWTAKTLTSSTAKSQETEFGADFMGVFEAKLPGYDIAKGFLAQSKRVEPGSTFSAAESLRLRDQCKKMLDHSPDSFVFIYSQQAGILVAPASEVLASRDCNPHELMTTPMKGFYRRHFECFIGDHTIKTSTPAGLDALRNRHQARTALLLSGKPRA